MAYSSNKPYQRTEYRDPTGRTKYSNKVSYDRLLKEESITPNPESMLEKPYKSKTYSQMQQEYNVPLPPPWRPPPDDWRPPPWEPGPGEDPIVPIPGTGGLTCWWTATGCEQLVGCWAGSDLVLDGPEANTAGYLPLKVISGEVVSISISGSENRGIEIVLDPTETRNTFNVLFKDALGVIHSQTIDIECIPSEPLGSTFYTYANNTCTYYYSNMPEPPPARYTGGSYARFLAYHSSGAFTDRLDMYTSFFDVIIPPGSTITSAVMKFYKKNTATIVTKSADIAAFDVDDGLYYLGFNQWWMVSAVLPPVTSLTTAVGWTISEYGSSISNGYEFTTPDISSVIQTIIDRPGWASGNRIDILIVPTDGDIDVTDTFQTFDETAFPAKLVVTFT